MFERNAKWAAGTLVAVLAFGSAGCLAAMVDGEELIDPTAPFLLEMEGVVAQPAANLLAGLGNYDVSSILIRSNVRIAVINSQRVREGEYIGNARVISIEESGVTLDLGGELRELKLHSAASVKKSAGE